jgi:hypothetical protein
LAVHRQCSGSSYFIGGASASHKTQLTPTGTNQPPPNPLSNMSSINVHVVYNYWQHDFSAVARGTDDYGLLLQEEINIIKINKTPAL